MACDLWMVEKAGLPKITDQKSAAADLGPLRHFFDSIAGFLQTMLDDLHIVYVL